MEHLTTTHTGVSGKQINVFHSIPIQCGDLQLYRIHIHITSGNVFSLNTIFTLKMTSMLHEHYIHNLTHMESMHELAFTKLLAS